MQVQSFLLNINIRVIVAALLLQINLTLQCQLTKDLMPILSTNCMHINYLFIINYRFAISFVL